MAKTNINNISAIALVALFFLLGFSAYQWFQIKNLKTELASSKTTIQESEKMQAELEQDYQAALSNLEEMRGTNTELNEMIDQQKKELSAQKSKVSSLIWVKGEYEKAKEELESFKAMSAQYAQQIRELKDSNMALSSANSSLTAAKTELEETVVVKNQKINELDEKTNMLTKLKTKIEGENTTLSGKVDIAEAIKINFISVNGYKDSGDGKTREKSRAKSVNLLKTCFKTESNYVVAPGKELFQIRFIKPSGETLVNDGSGSGEITNKLDGSKVKYTTTATLQYANEDAETCVDWRPGFTLPEGNYGVELYNKGYMVGKGNFLMK